MQLAYLYAAAAGPPADCPAVAGGFAEPQPAAITATLEMIRNRLVIILSLPLVVGAVLATGR
jgi:hypothetical protein